MSILNNNGSWAINPITKKYSSIKPIENNIPLVTNSKVWNKSKGIYEDEIPIVDNSLPVWNKSEGIYGNKINTEVPKLQISKSSLPQTEGDSILQDLDLAKLENKGFDINTVMTGKTLDQRIGTKAVTAAVDASKKVIPLSTSFKAPSIIGMANIATGVSSLINAGVSLKGAMDAGKMQPSLMKPYVPTEAKLVADNTSAIQTAGQENIDKSINTNRADLTRKGIVGMEGVLIGKETEALNQLGGQLAQYRTGIDTANAQIENSVNAQNKQAEMQTEQFNAQTQNQFDQYKSGLIGMGMKNATDAIASGTQSIFNNTMAGKQNEVASITSELSQINNLMTNNPNWHATPGVVPADVIARKKQLEEQLNSINKSIV